MISVISNVQLPLNQNQITQNGMLWTTHSFPVMRKFFPIPTRKAEISDKQTWDSWVPFLVGIYTNTCTCVFTYTFKNKSFMKQYLALSHAMHPETFLFSICVGTYTN